MKWFRQNCLFFAKTSALDNRGIENYQVTSTKLLYFCKKYSLVITKVVQNSKSHQQNCFILGKVYCVIIGPVQIFKWYHQNCFSLWKISALDNTTSAKVQVTSKLSLWVKILARNSRDSLSIQLAEMTYFGENFSSW